MTQISRGGENLNCAFSLAIADSKLSPGSYAFLVSLVQIKSYRPVTKLVTIIASRDRGDVWYDPDFTTPVLVDVLEHGRDAAAVAPSSDEFERLKHQLIISLEKLKAEWEAREQRLDQARREQQHAARATAIDFRLKRARERIDALRNTGAGEFPFRMAQAQLEKAERERESFMTNSTQSKWGGIEHEETAVGLLFVGGQKNHA